MSVLRELGSGVRVGPTTCAIFFGSGAVLLTMSSLEWIDIEIVLRGKRVKGRYNVSEGLVTVAAWSGTNTTPLGILPAERLAKMLLRELASREQEK